GEGSGEERLAELCQNFALHVAPSRTAPSSTYASSEAWGRSRSPYSARAQTARRSSTPALVAASTATPASPSFSAQERSDPAGAFETVQVATARGSSARAP